MQLKNYLSLVKFSHTIFALPFALLGFFLGTLWNNEGIQILLLALVILCMIFARSAAMAFNRYLDRDIDGLNPRTQTREIPAGKISPTAALTFVVINCTLFIVTTWFINPLCFFLSPIALTVVLGYSFTKRFTALCHLILGLGLALAPIGAFIAVTGQFDFTPIIYSFAVLTWVAGFDIIYALQDESFDKSLSLNSIPVFFGKKRALIISNLLHFLTALLLIGASFLLQSHFPNNFFWLHWIAVSVFIALLLYQHSIVKVDDLSRINIAFFTTNGIASLVFCSLVIIDIYL